MNDELILYNNENYLVNPAYADMIVEFERQVEDIRAKEDALKTRIKEEMEAKGILKAESEKISITYVGPTKSETLDGKALKKELPDIYSEYTRLTERKGYIKIKVKE